MAFSVLPSKRGLPTPHPTPSTAEPAEGGGPSGYAMPEPFT